MLQRLVDIKTDATAAFKKESKVLLVRLDNDSVMLALADKESGTWEAAEILKVDADGHTDDTFITNLKQLSSLVHYKGLSTYVLVATPEAMPVPATLQEDVSLFFEMQFGSQHLPVLTEVVDENRMMAFAQQAWQQALIAILFPEARIVNTLALQIRQGLLHAREGGTCLYVQVGKAYAEVVLVRQGGLALARSLIYPTPEDLLYHLLNVARQFRLQPASLSVQLQGLITEEDAVHKMLSNYFAPVSFAGDITPIRHKAFWKVPPHFFTGLMYRV